MRKNVDDIYANERPVKSIKGLIKEVEVSGAKSCSLTGGDPLLKFDRTMKLAGTLKKRFGKNFHIHIYLSTKLVNEDKLKRLSKVVDEVRFHPDFDKNQDEELEKIKLAGKFWKKSNIGVEIPSFPDKTKKMYDFIMKAKDYISFLNLNELEAGEILGPLMAKKYSLNKNGYTVKSSVSSGIKLAKRIRKSLPELNIHMCTSRLKNWHQYGNRLKNYRIPKFSEMTEDGTIIYFSIEKKNETLLNKEDFIRDNKKNQIIINPLSVRKIGNGVEIFRVEEYPTYDREEILREKVQFS
jgi:pyruvate formate-lyase activating enzyme-like uncharacterized protein